MIISATDNRSAPDGRTEICSDSKAGDESRWPWGALPAVRNKDADWPKISLVVPNYNYGHFIEETLRSIVLQDYPNLELIVIDGGSTDASLDVIRRYGAWVDYLESEPDRGQAHAINKGLRRVSGAIVNWVNSDDLLLPGALEALAGAHRENPQAILAGDVIFSTEHGKTSRLHHQNLSFDTIADPQMKTRWMQPGIFVPTSILSGQGDLDESLRYQFDRDWMLKLSLKAPVVSIDHPVLQFRVHDEQRSLENMAAFFEEGYSVIERYVSSMKGVSRLDIQAGYDMAMASLHLAEHPHYAPYWSRAAGAGFLWRALIKRPGNLFNSEFLRLFRRALTPRLLMRSKVGLR